MTNTGGLDTLFPHQLRLHSVIPHLTQNVGMRGGGGRRKINFIWRPPLRVHTLGGVKAWQDTLTCNVNWTWQTNCAFLCHLWVGRHYFNQPQFLMLHSTVLNGRWEPTGCLVKQCWIRPPWLKECSIAQSFSLWASWEHQLIQVWQKWMASQAWFAAWCLRIKR